MLVGGVFLMAHNVFDNSCSMNKKIVEVQVFYD